MPHSKSGKPLQIGDRVSIECIVKQIYAGEDFYNVNLESVEGAQAGGVKESITLNTAVVEKIEE
jgi:polynucleotide 5'-kinase involved in rRNA processing